MSSSKNKRAPKGTKKRSRKAKVVTTPSAEMQVATLVFLLKGMSQANRVAKPAKTTRKSVDAAMASFGEAIGNPLIGDPEQRPAELVGLCLQMKAGALINALSREGKLVVEYQKVDPSWVYGQARPKAASKRWAVAEVVETPVVADAVPSPSEGESDGALPADLPEMPAPEPAPEVKPEPAPEPAPEDSLIEAVVRLMNETRLTAEAELIISDMGLQDGASLEVIVARIEEMQRECAAVGLVYSAFTSGVKGQSDWDGRVDRGALKKCRSRLTSGSLINPLFYATNCGLYDTLRLADSLGYAAAEMANGNVRSKGLLTAAAFALSATKKDGLVIWEDKELPILPETQAAIRQTMTLVGDAVKTYREEVANNNSPKGVKGAAMSSSTRKKGANKAPKPVTKDQESAPIALPEPPPEASSVPVSTEDAPKVAEVVEVVEAPKPKAASPTYVVSPLVARLSGIKPGAVIVGCAGKKGCNPSFKAMRKILEEWDATDPVTLDLIAFLEVVKNVHGKTHCAVTARQARVMAQKLKVMDNKRKREAKLAANAPVEASADAPVEATVEAAPVVADAPVSVEAPKPTEAQLALEQLIAGAGVEIDAVVCRVWRATVDARPAVITEAAKYIEGLQAKSSANDTAEAPKVSVKPEPEAPKAADSNAGANKAPEEEDTVGNGTPNEKGANAPKPAAEQPAPQPAPEVAPEPAPEPGTGFFQQIADGVVRLSNRVGDAIQGLRDASKMKIETLALPEPTEAEAKTVQDVATSMVAYGDDLGKSEIIIPTENKDGLLSQVIRALSTQTLRACTPQKGRVVAPAVALNDLLSGNAKSGDPRVARAALEQLALHVQVRMNLAGVSVSADLEALKRAEAKAPEGDVKTCLQDIIKEVAEVGCSTSRLRRTMFRVGQLEALENPVEAHRKELETLRAVLKAVFEETQNEIKLLPTDGRFHFMPGTSKDLIGFTKELSRQLCASSLVNPDGNIHRLIDNSSKKASDVACAASIADAIAYAVIKVLAVKDDGVASETFIRELLFISTVQGSTVRAKGGKTSKERATKGLYYVAMGSHLVVFGTVDAISWVVNALGATGKSAAYAARALYHLGLGLLTGNEETREKARRDIQLSKSCIAQLGGSKGEGVWSIIRDHFRRVRTEGKGADKRPALDAEGEEMQEHWAWTVALSPVRLVTGAAKLVDATLSRIPGVRWVYNGIKSCLSTAWSWCKGLFSKANDAKDAVIVASS